MPNRFTSDPAEVSARMRLIRGKGTKPELALFSILAGANIPYEPHKRVSGVSVDAAVDNRILLFVDSPFWHLRDTKELERLSPYWQARLLRNRRRDRKQVGRLRAEGFTVIRLWADELDKVRVLRRVRTAMTKSHKGHHTQPSSACHG